MRSAIGRYDGKLTSEHYNLIRAHGRLHLHRNGGHQMRIPRAARWSLALAMFVAACSDGTSPPPAVTVTGIGPDHGPMAGGTAVTVTGTNFPTTVDSVRVGTGRVGSLVRVSATQLTGTTPTGGAVATVDVTVFTASAGTGRCGGCFTYTLDPPGTWTSLTAGFNHTCGLASGGAAYCWGYNRSGQLGVGDSTDRSYPVAVSGGITFASLAAEGDHTCGLTTGGAAYCWGDNVFAEIGDGTQGGSRLAPVPVAGNLVFQAISPGVNHTCGLTTGGAAYCWGTNADGELGDSTTFVRRAPVAVSGGIRFANLTAGWNWTCGLTSGGAAYCWGSNASGQLGIGASGGTRLLPVVVAGGLTFQGLSAGASHACGLSMAGLAWCWGDNSSGQAGPGNSGNTLLQPFSVSGNLVFWAISAGYQHTCSLTTGAAAYCWGRNSNGALGDATTTDRSTPGAVSGGLTFQAITTGEGYTCGIASGGVAYCWGFNHFGQLGDGSTLDRHQPVAVAGP